MPDVSRQPTMELDFDNPPADPVSQLQAWLDEAATCGLINPHAMALATVEADGAPSARTVLLKGLDAEGALFFTNHRSRKGRALEACPRAALLFYWDPMGRQVTIEGAVSRVDDRLSDEYFAGRPRDSQIGAWASEQSEPAADRAALETRFAEVTEEYAGGDVPRPPHWGGYRVSLQRIEFWRSRLGRLHDRIVYEPDGDGWTVTRLSP